MPAEQLSSNFQYFSLKFRVILTTRYLNVRVLLHRPVLVKFISASRSPDYDSQDLMLLKQIGMNSMQICMESAMEIIDIVFAAVSEPGWKESLLGPWWFSLYYTFNAALVILDAVWVYDVSLGIFPVTAGQQVKKAQEYPGRAVRVLSKLDDGNRLIDSCRYYLEQFNRVIQELRSPDYDPSGPLPTFGPGNRSSLPAGDFGLSRFGMLELGEFMMDDDLLAMIDRQAVMTTDRGSSFPP